MESIGNDLVEFIKLEKSSPRLEVGISKHDIEQLVESNMGRELTASAHEINDSNKDISNETVSCLSQSSSFQLVHGAIQHCHLSLRDGNDTMDYSNKTPKTSDPPKAAPTSFSLFDMLDQQGTFTMPPRITAGMIIEAHLSEGADDHISDGDCEPKSCLELLEQAEDIDDLSPDPETWEQIRLILFHGLTNNKNIINIQARYLQVHTTLLCICQRGNGGGNNKAQWWDLAQNLVGSLILHSKVLMNDLEKSENHIASMNQYMNFYWDLVERLLASLSHLALDYISSCVGDEKQIERMVLGMCFILVNDCSAITSAAMDPLAGWFEVWARFVPPKRMSAIVTCSGLGGVVLQRCYQLGSCASAEKLVNVLNRDDASITAGTVQHANYLQSLSILRTLLNQCTPSSATIMHHQFIDLNKGASKCISYGQLSDFLSPNGVVQTEHSYKLLNQVNVEMDDSKQDSIDVVVKPFQDALTSKELDEVPYVKWLCNTSLGIFSRSNTE